MKAVVVELNNHKAAVLSDDGCVITVKNNNYEIGQVIQMDNSKQNIKKKITVIAASAAACLTLGFGTWAYASPYTYVSVDVNPSIEYTVNRFDRVIKVRAVNDDGEEILKEISLNDLTNETITEAIKTTVQEISDAGYFDGETEGGVVIATSSEDTEKADDMATELQDAVEQETEANGDDVAVEAFSVGLERVEEARELGVTPGKLNLVEKLMEAAGESSDITVEEWLNKPVKEIMKATKEYRKSEETSSEEDPADTVEDTTDEDGIDEDTTDEDTSDEDNSDVETTDETNTEDLLTSDDDNNEDKYTRKSEKVAEKANKDAKKAEEKDQKKTAKVEDSEDDEESEDSDDDVKSEDDKDSKVIKDKEQEKSDKATKRAKEESESDTSDNEDADVEDQISRDKDSEDIQNPEDDKDNDNKSDENNQDNPSDNSSSSGNSGKIR